MSKSVLGSSLGKGSFCSSEIKHDRRTAPRPKLFSSARRLQEQMPELRKSVLGSRSDEDIFCSSETKHDRRMRQFKQFLGDCRNKGLKAEETVLGSRTGEGVFCTLETVDGRRKIRPALFVSAKRL
jgi:hypothetical protein